MQGTKRQRGPNTWELRVALGRGPDGRYRQTSRTFHGTKKEADKALRALVVQAEGGKLGHLHERATTGDVLERWFALRSPDLSPTTVRTYRGYLDNHIIPALGTVPLDKLTTDRLDAFYGSLRAKGMGVSSVRQNHAIIHRALAQAKRWKLVGTNEASDVTLPTKRRSELDPPEAEEVRAMIDALAGDREYAMFLLLKAEVGARRGEMCGLRWPRVDFEANTVTIARAVIDGVPGGWVEKDTKTHAVRTVIVDERVTAALMAHRLLMEDRAARADAELRPDAFVFSRRIDGAEPWRPGYTTTRFRKLRESLGLRYFRQHDIRHFAATALMEQMDAVNVAARLGWSDPSMLFRVYGHASVEQDKRAAKIMGELLAPQTREIAPPPTGGEPEGDGAEGEETKD